MRDRRNRTLYVGITENTLRRTIEHIEDGKEFRYLEVETEPISKKDAEAWETQRLKSYRDFTGRNPKYNKTPDGKWHYFRRLRQ